MLEYNEETRVHYIDGIKVPSVSQLLPRDEVWVDDETYEAARLDGIDRHSRIERYLDTGDTNFDLMLEKFAELVDQRKPGKLLLHEQPLFSREFMFCGKPDILWEFETWDQKRSFGRSVKHALQLAAYDILREENGYGSNNEWWVAVWDGEEWKMRDVFKKYQDSREWFLTLVRFYWYFAPKQRTRRVDEKEDQLREEGKTQE
jgi:hypothetical protein